MVIFHSYVSLPEGIHCHSLITGGSLEIFEGNSWDMIPNPGPPCHRAPVKAGNRVPWKRYTQAFQMKLHPITSNVFPNYIQCFLGRFLIIPPSLPIKSKCSLLVDWLLFDDLAFRHLRQVGMSYFCLEKTNEDTLESLELLKIHELYKSDRMMCIYVYIYT